jgi:hypothetical protein
MQQKFSFLFLFLLFGHWSNAQLSVTNAEQVSYDWYIKENWDSLLENRNKLLSNGNDYYYLRYRLGEAAFHKGKYRQAATDFNRATQLNSSDSFSTAFLASSLFLTGRLSEAILAGKQLKRQKASKRKYFKSEQLNFLYTEAGNKWSSDKDISENLHFLHLANSIQIIPSTNVVIAFSNLSNSNYYSDVEQNVLYSKIKYQLRNAWSIEAFYNYLDVVVKYKSSQGNLPTSNYYLQNQVFGANMLRSFTKWDVNLGGSYSNLSNNLQTQINAGFMFYPKSDNSLFAGIQITFHNEDDGKGNISNLLIRPSVGVNLLPKLWFTIDYYKGDAYNFTENSGYLVNNAVDLTRWRLNGSLQWFLHTKAALFLTYQHEARTERLLRTNYSLNNLFLGLRYNPWAQ